MKRKTYNNVLKASKIIQKKGYSSKEANEIALKVFDEHENDVMPIEFYLEKIITKEEYEKETAAICSMRKGVLYLVLDSKNTKWCVSDSFEKFIPMCKYLLSSASSLDDFRIIWTDGKKKKEKPFLEFCEIQGIKADVPEWRK